jgi:hypothetical protein
MASASSIAAWRNGRCCSKQTRPNRASSRLSAALLLVGLWSAAAVAQEPGALNGKWSATFVGLGGGDREAELVVSDAGGTWRDFSKGHQAKNNKCFGHEFPVAIQSRSATEMTFEVNASSVLEGCTDMVATVKVVDGKTLEGNFRNGIALKLTRQ